MAIKWISSAWQTAKQTTFPQDERVYVDFRQRQYPEVAGSPTFTLITSADNQPGSHNFTGGYADYLLDMPSTLIIDAYFKPTFAYDTAANKHLACWRIDATHILSVVYDASIDRFSVLWQDAGTARNLIQASAYTSNGQLQVWTRLTASLNLTTGTTAGSAFYTDGALSDSAWSGAIDVKASNFPKLNVRNVAGTEYEYTISYIRIFPNKTATAAEVANNFKDLKEEEIVWHYNGHAMGHTRCNVTGRTTGLEMEKTTESPIGNANANMASITLLSPQGQFADDQYAAFDPAAEIYNGTSTQKYMQERCPVEIESWYGGLYELEFVGRVNEDRFTRRSSINSVSMVTIGAKDGVDDMKRRVRQKAYSFVGYDLCKPSDETTSLLHTIVKMSTQPEWFNFFANSSFENTTAANSWTVVGGGAALTRTAGGIVGSFTGNLLCATTATMTQTVTFTGTKLLNVGQNYNVSLYGKSATGITATLSLLEIASGGTALQTVSVAQAFTTDMTKIEKTLTVGSSLAAKLQGKIALASAATFVMDAAMLIQNDRALDWFVLNNNDGAAGVASADDADSATYDTAGFDVDDAPFTHPFAVVAQGEPIFSSIQEISDATAARYMGFDACGTFKYRTPFKAGYADPSSIIEITSTQGVDAVIDIQQANKIVIHGIKISTDGTTTFLWNAYLSSFFDRDANGFLYEAVANGATWPAPATYGEFWASYDVVKQGTPLGPVGGWKWLS